PGEFPPVPEKGPWPGVGAVHHRCDPGGRPKPRRATPDRAREDPRADYGPAPAHRSGNGPHPVRHGVAGRGPVVRQLHLRGGAAAGPAPVPWKVVGVDAGVKHLAILSTGEKWPNPRSLEKALRKIARPSRALARRQKGSRGWQQARRRLARLHARARNLRQDALHKLTHHLASTYG